MQPKDADGIANSVDPDLGAVWSVSALFAQTYLSENLGSLWYYMLGNFPCLLQHCSITESNLKKNFLIIEAK